jgi:hypothetical protein
VDVLPSRPDRTNVTGTTLADTVAASFQAGSYVSEDYTIGGVAHSLLDIAVNIGLAK